MGVLTQLARRLGLTGHPIIAPDKVGGYLQDIRGKNAVPVTENDAKPFANAAPVLVDLMRGRPPFDLTVMEADINEVDDSSVDSTGGELVHTTGRIVGGDELASSSPGWAFWGTLVWASLPDFPRVSHQMSHLRQKSRKADASNL